MMTFMIPHFFIVLLVVFFISLVLMLIVRICSDDDDHRKIRLTKTIYENGDYSITTDKDHNPFSKIKEEFYQDVFIDEDLWRREERQ